jgi:hypothetical protein
MGRKNRFFALFGVLAVAALFLGILFGTVSAAPAASAGFSVVAADRANAAIAPSSQVTGSVDVNVQQQPQGQDAGGTTTTQTTNVGINVPWWVWLVALLVLVLIVALIAGNRGGTTVIKD